MPFYKMKKIRIFILPNVEILLECRPIIEWENSLSFSNKKSSPIEAAIKYGPLRQILFVGHLNGSYYHSKLINSLLSGILHCLGLIFLSLSFYFISCGDHPLSHKYLNSLHLLTSFRITLIICCFMYCVHSCCSFVNNVRYSVLTQK